MNQNPENTKSRMEKNLKEVSDDLSKYIREKKKNHNYSDNILVSVIDYLSKNIKFLDKDKYDVDIEILLKLRLKLTTIIELFPNLNKGISPILTILNKVITSKQSNNSKLLLTPSVNSKKTNTNEIIQKEINNIKIISKQLSQEITEEKLQSIKNMFKREINRIYNDLTSININFSNIEKLEELINKLSELKGVFSNNRNNDLKHLIEYLKYTLNGIKKQLEPVLNEQLRPINSSKIISNTIEGLNTSLLLLINSYKRQSKSGKYNQTINVEVAKLKQIIEFIYDQLKDTNLTKYNQTELTQLKELLNRINLYHDMKEEGNTLDKLIKLLNGEPSALSRLNTKPSALSRLNTRSQRLLYNFNRKSIGKPSASAISSSSTSIYKNTDKTILKQISNLNKIGSTIVNSKLSGNINKIKLNEFKKNIDSLYAILKNSTELFNSSKLIELKNRLNYYKELLGMNLKNSKLNDLMETLKDFDKEQMLDDNWKIKKVDPDGTCGYHAIAESLKYYNGSFNNIKYNSMKEGIVNRRKGFSFRINCAKVAEEMISQILELTNNNKKIIYGYSINDLIKKFQEVHNKDELIDKLLVLQKRFSSFNHLVSKGESTCSVENYMQEDEIIFISLIYRKYIFVYEKRFQFGQSWNKYGSGYGEATEFNSIFIIQFPSHFDLLLPREGIEFKPNFEDFEVTTSNNIGNNVKKKVREQYNFFK